MLRLITKKGSLLKGSRVALRVTCEKNRQTKKMCNKERETNEKFLKKSLRSQIV